MEQFLESGDVSPAPAAAAGSNAATTSLAAALMMSRRPPSSSDDSDEEVEEIEEEIEEEVEVVEEQNNNTESTDAQPPPQRSAAFEEKDDDDDEPVAVVVPATIEKNDITTNDAPHPNAESTKAEVHAPNAIDNDSKRSDEEGDKTEVTDTAAAEPTSNEAEAAEMTSAAIVAVASKSSRSPVHPGMSADVCEEIRRILRSRSAASTGPNRMPISDALRAVVRKYQLQQTILEDLRRVWRDAATLNNKALLDCGLLGTLVDAQFQHVNHSLEDYVQEYFKVQQEEARKAPQTVVVGQKVVVAPVAIDNHSPVDKHAQSGRSPPDTKSSDNSKKLTMNANAKPFVPNVGAPPFQPFVPPQSFIPSQLLVPPMLPPPTVPPGTPPPIPREALPTMPMPPPPMKQPTTAPPPARNEKGLQAERLQKIRKDESEERKRRMVSEAKARADSQVSSRKSVEIDPTRTPVAYVEFKRSRIKKFPSAKVIEPGNYVIVTGDRGLDCGLLVQMTAPTRGGVSVMTMEGTRIDDHKIKWEHNTQIIRIAEADEIEMLHEKIPELERTALQMCRDVCRTQGLGIELLDCEFQFDRKKISFYFFSEISVDFRELVKELYRAYGARIWMENVNPHVRNTSVR